MANPEHVDVVNKGTYAIWEWTQKNPGVRLDLSGENLSKADLSGANLSESDLTRSNLTEAALTKANLSRAVLVGANLSVADLSEANLTKANPPGSNIRFVLLRQADLSAADFQFTNLFCSYPIEANLSKAILGATSIGRCDLSRCVGLETVKHEAPSSIAVDTLIASFRGAGNSLTPELYTFFRGAGVSEELLKALPSIVSGAGVSEELLRALPNIVSEIKYYTCFVSYGEPDREFAENLVKELEAKGIACWLYSKDSTPGERSRKEIIESRHQAGKIIVICSVQSLIRDNFQNEIEDQIDEDPNKIVPVSLDNVWTQPGFRIIRGNRNLKDFLMEPTYADFSDPSKYEESLDRLLKGLKRKGSQESIPPQGGKEQRHP